GKGTATITITSKDDPSISTIVKVTVTVPEEPTDPEPSEPSEPEEPEVPSEPEKIPVEDIIVSGFTMELGEKKNLEATVLPENATDKELIYSSSDSSVVKVDKDGNVEAVGGGTAIITVTTADGSVKKGVEIHVDVPVKEIVPDEDVIELNVGEKDKIYVSVKPNNASHKEVSYKSKNPDVVTVDDKGNITAVGEGEATIVIASKYDPSKIATVTVKVTKPPYTIEVPDSFTVYEGETAPLGVVVTPDNGTIIPSYSIADKSVAEIDADGNITGISAGITTVTVSFSNGEIRTVPVVVLAPVDIPMKHHVCFGKTDGIGWYEVSVNGGDFFPQGPNSTLEVDEGSILVVRVQDMWIDDEFDFYVNGKKVPMDPANTITVVVDGYMLIGALSMDVPVPDVDESLNIFQKALKAITDFFAKIKNWFSNLFS
ncbi:MAG: Ig domain-containing protein, partial [Clostridia bacterium]|nr:Ig domain-containing protein [Clostridia bacterium]